MTISQYTILLSAGLGFAGSALLYWGTFGLEPLAAGGFAEAAIQHNQGVRLRNETRKRLQQAGLLLLALSFFVQAITAFLG